jgi:hypothetical protein
MAGSASSELILKPNIRDLIVAMREWLDSRGDCAAPL